MARELRMLLLWGRRLRAPALAAACGGKPVLCPWRPPAQSWGPPRSLASSFHVGRPFSSQAAEDQAEAGPLHSVISSLEAVQGSATKHEFQAETKKLLDIVARSLYSEKEVFIRELISNASDALEKLRHKLVSEGQALPDMEIHLQTDADRGTITIQDTGVGMSREELVSNLGTIARSGSKAFLDALQNQAEAGSKIIGQFGVGFYSAFMVADRVEVYSRSVDAGSLGYRWLSDGSGVFEVAEASGVRTGTKIIIHLKADSREFASEARVRDVVTKYSNFVSFPLYLNGRRMNTLQAIWMMDPKDVGEGQHEEFYRYVAQAHDRPRYTLHYRTDAPLSIRSIFYVPDAKPSMFDVSRELGSSVSLYSRKVLIQTKATNILPTWLRFVRGVVDSEDIPLNLSRELLQESALIRKLQGVLQQRLIKFFTDQSKKDAEKYARFFEDYGLFVREGIVTTAEQEVKVSAKQRQTHPSFQGPLSKSHTYFGSHTAVRRAGERGLHTPVPCSAREGGHREAAAVRVVSTACWAADQPLGLRQPHAGRHPQHLLPVCPQPAPGGALALLRGHEAEKHGGGPGAPLCPGRRLARLMTPSRPAQVLFCYEQFDELTLLHLREFDKKKLISVETDIVVDHYKEEKFEDGAPAGDCLSEKETEDLMAWMRNALGSRITDVKVTLRLDTHPAMITVLEMGAARHFLRMRQLAKTQEERAQLLQPTLEINPRHVLIKKLSQLRDSEPDLAQLLVDQIYENAMITAGLIDDPRPMVGRLNQLLVKALERH
uniref:Heat shock protein 75 kDa, mitochondrial n=1 Tax=Bos taurus TaxID=9913 RepID=A0AAA9TAG7_BOVIN